MNIVLKYKNQLIIAGILLVGLLAMSVPLIFASSNAIDKSNDDDPCIPVSEIKDEEDNYIFVDIKGEVKKPGVYKMPSGSIVQDVIEEAGGLKSTAYTKNINLSKTLTNEMVIIINSKSEMKNQTTTTKVADIKNDAQSNLDNAQTNNDACVCESNETTTSTNTNTSTLVNINTASKEELMSVSGIGASKADAIIVYRSESKFNTIEDIKNVSGIGESLFAKIKDYITV